MIMKNINSFIAFSAMIWFPYLFELFFSPLDDSHISSPSPTPPPVFFFLSFYFLFSLFEYVQQTANMFLYRIQIGGLNFSLSI